MCPTVALILRSAGTARLEGWGRPHASRRTPSRVEDAGKPARGVLLSMRPGESGVMGPATVPASLGLFRRLGLGARLRPIVGGLLRALERVHGFEARRHRRVGAGENLVMLDVERAQPALLPHGQRDEIADLDQLGLAETLVQAGPELVVDRQIPGDRLGIG